MRIIRSLLACVPHPLAATVSKDTVYVPPRQQDTVQVRLNAKVSHSTSQFINHKYRVKVLFVDT